MNKSSFGFEKVLLCASALILLLFSVVHLAGFRAYTSVWSGVLPSSFQTELAGLLYIGLYLCVICIAPILGCTGILLWIQRLSLDK